MEETQVQQIVTYLQSTGYEGDFWTSARFDLWCEELADLDFEITRDVVRTWVQTEDRPPTIADIRRNVNEVEARNREGERQIERVRREQNLPQPSMTKEEQLGEIRGMIDFLKEKKAAE